MSISPARAGLIFRGVIASSAPSTGHLRGSVRATSAGGATLAVALAGRRDLSAAVIARRTVVRDQLRLLGSPALLVARPERWVSLAWIAGLTLLALIFGIVARSAAGSSGSVSQSIEQAVGRLGSHHASVAAAWMGYEFLFIAALVAFAAAGHISAKREEEADGHLDNLLARHVKRATWVAGHLGFAATLIVTIGLAAGIVGSSITSNHLLLDTALFSHLGPVPAASVTGPPSVHSPDSA
jgi:putative exporter of polyketide antibiotics